MDGIQKQMINEDGFTKVRKGKERKESKAVQAYRDWANCVDFDVDRGSNFEFKKSKNRYALLDEKRMPRLSEYSEPDSDRDIDELLHSSNVWSRVERNRFDLYIRKTIPEQAEDALETCCLEFNELTKKKQSLRESTEQRVLAGARIIGATTTGRLI